MLLTLLKLTTIVTAALIPTYSFADGVANSVGNGVSSVVGGVGQGVGDVGTGVGNAVKDVGNGIGNAVNGKQTNPASDSDITTRAQNKIQELSDNNKIASGSNLNVQTTNGRVNITGTVTNSADIATVKDAVNNLSGVRNVKTNITVQN